MPGSHFIAHHSCRHVSIWTEGPCASVILPLGFHIFALVELSSQDMDRGRTLYLA